MSFQIPDTAKSVSPTWKRTYGKYLNRIAEISDIDTIQKVLKNPKTVIDAIDLLILVEDDLEKQKYQARVYYSALFYVLYGQPILKKQKNIFRKNFHRFNPTLTGDKEWVSAYKD